MLHLSTDLAVIGLGPAGLAACISAAEEGLSVLGFEKASVVGGAANMGGGPFGVESRIQKQAMCNFTKEDAFREFMDYTHWKCNARLVRDYFWKSGDTIDWLEDMGVKFAGIGKFYEGSWETWHKVQPEGGGPSGMRAAATMTKVMHQRALDLGVKIYTGTSVTKLLKENDKIAGLTAQHGNDEITVSASAIIIATGGFGDNPDMIKSECGYTYGKDIFNFRVPGLAGDGLRLAWEAGGARGTIDMETNTKTRVPDECFALANIFNQPNLLVNLSGERIMNEQFSDNPAILANVLKQQPGKTGIMICSSYTVRQYRRHGLDWAGIAGQVFGNTMNYLDDQLETAKELAPEKSYITDVPIEELANFFDINLENLLETIKEYNECCDDGYDDIFNKAHKYLRPIEGNVWGGVIALSAYGSLGGIKINYKTQVLDKNYNQIPGLFAAGTDVCDIYAGTYLYKLPGNTMGFAVNTGRMAGEYAADYINT